MLVYRKQSKLLQLLFQALQCLLATNSIDIIAWHFNYFAHQVQMVDKPIENIFSLDRDAAMIVIEKIHVVFCINPYNPIWPTKKEELLFF